MTPITQESLRKREVAIHLQATLNSIDSALRAFQFVRMDNQKWDLMNKREDIQNILDIVEDNDNDENQYDAELV